MPTERDGIQWADTAEREYLVKLCMAAVLDRCGVTGTASRAACERTVDAFVQHCGRPYRADYLDTNPAPPAPERRGAEGDIVARLLARSQHLVCTLDEESARLCAEAADEIDRLRAELAETSDDDWHAQAALSEIKLLVPLDESTDGPKAGWAGIVERVRCLLRRHRAELARAAGELDGVYTERNRLVAALARLGLSLGWRVGIAQTAIDGWEPAWHGCVYIDAPTGQMSWHFHERERDLFQGLPAYDGAWDGHSTPAKYERLAALRAAAGGGAND